MKSQVHCDCAYESQDCGAGACIVGGPFPPCEGNHMCCQNNNEWCLELREIIGVCPFNIREQASEKLVCHLVMFLRARLVLDRSEIFIEHDVVLWQYQFSDRIVH